MNTMTKKYTFMQAAGFTLVELMVVVAVIAVVMGIVLPNMNNIMGGQSQSQAFNLIDAKLRVARAKAIRDRRYVAVHFQPHHETGDMWCAMMVLDDLEDPREYDSDLGRTTFHDDGPTKVRCINGQVWTLMSGSKPSKLPGNWRVGIVCADLGDDYSDLHDNNFEDHSEFDKFSVVFDSYGKTMTYDQESDERFIYYDGSDFYVDPLFDLEDPSYIWDVPYKTDTIVNALCLYDGKEFELLDEDGKVDYLNNNAAFLVVNPRMGGLIHSAVE